MPGSSQAISLQEFSPASVGLPELTVFSYGGGQDGTAFLYRLGRDPEFRKRWAPGRLLMIMADTGDEKPGTYKQVERARRFCDEHDIEFHFITRDMGYHSKSWATLRTQYRLNKNVGSKAYVKSCTDNLKIKPIYRFLEEWIEREYGIPGGRKRGFYRFVGRYGRIRVILGIAAGEEGRAAGNDNGPLWMQRCIDRVYPLIDELGWDRQACQDYIVSVGMPLPPPSNCLLCPFMDLVELLWLYKNHRADYEEWVGFEAAKIEEHARRGVPAEKNFGVWGRKRLPEVLVQAEEKHGHMSADELTEHMMSHGHCVRSRY